MIGRRVFLGGVAAGVLNIVTGGRLLPRLDLPASGGWRIYNVAGAVPAATGFRLRVDGLVGRTLDLDLRGVGLLPAETQVSDFECVTGWRVRNVRWRGVRLEQLLGTARAQPGATHLVFHSRDGIYVDSLSIDDATDGKTMLATDMDGAPLPRRHGGPLRLVVPAMYGYKSVKWLGRIEVTDHEVIGYWEQRGYARDARIESSVDRYAGARRAIPGTDLTVDVPRGWTVQTLPGGGATVSTTTDPAGKVEASIIVVPTTARADREMTRSLLAGLERSGLESSHYGAARAGGLAGDTLEASDGTGQRFLFAFFPDGRRVVQVLGQAPFATWSRWRPVLRQLAGSLRPA